MTSNGTSYTSLDFLPRNARPRLLASNRKIRHLRGVSLRNLCLAASPQRCRSQTFDDEALPYSLKSPTKLLAIEENALHHSKSFSDFDSSLKNTGNTDQWKSSNGDSGRSENRSPTATKSRPKATLQRQDSTPLSRQQSAQDAISRRIGDVFFTLHCHDGEDPIYVSEVLEQTMNPDFRLFDLGACGPAVSRREHISLKIWAKSHASRDWTYLMDLTLSLPSLQYIGKTLEGHQYPFPENCVLFHLDDGIYTSFTNLPVEQNELAVPVTQVESIPSVDVELTSSYDALLRLQTLDENIHDAFNAQYKLAAEINRLITEDTQRFYTHDDIGETRDSLAATRRSVTTARRLVKTTRTRLSESRQSIQARQHAIRQGDDAQKSMEKQMEDERLRIEKSRVEFKQLQESLTGQRRRIAADLDTIFPITPIPSRTLAFTIRSLPLPNSNFSSSSSPESDTISAALGHAAHGVSLLAHYLSISLPYPVKPRSSTSTIDDPVSLMTGDRTFPLYIKNSVFYRFEYGVFLLNKNIELIASKLGLRILDIRQTLPNLKYVLYVASAGQGELPTRKAGGVRGLLREKIAERELGGAMGAVRRGSSGSVGSDTTMVANLKQKVLGRGR